MTRFLAARLLSTAVALAGALLLVSLFLRLVPGNAAELVLGEQAGELDPATLERCLGTDKPAWREVADFARDLATGALVTTVPPCRARVLPVVAEKLPRTLALALAAMLVAIAISLPLGALAGARPGSRVDGAATGFALLGAAVPRLWLGPLLIILFSIRLDWLPVSGAEEGLRSLALPAATLGTALAAILTRITRASVLEVAGEDYVRTARAKGLGEGMVLAKHTLRNALVPVITVAGLQFGALLGGAIITEKVFNWPGMGTLLVGAIERRDYNTVRACVLIFTFLYILVNLATDLLYALADPRLRGKR